MQITKRKRQIMLSCLVLALGAAVFANWYITGPVKNPAVSEDLSENSENRHNLGDAVFVDSSDVSDEYFAQAKLSRDVSYDEAVATLMEIIECSDVDEQSVKTATNSMNTMAAKKVTQTDIENLVKAKTGSNCIAVINDDDIKIVVKQDILTDAVILQIKEIVTELTEFSFENIIIIPAK